MQTLPGDVVEKTLYQSAKNGIYCIFPSAVWHFGKQGTLFCI